MRQNRCLAILGIFVAACAFGQGDDLSVNVETSADRFREGVLAEGEEAEGQPGEPGQPDATQQQQQQGPERLITTKLGWQKKGASRIYDAVDGRMIVNDVVVQPFRDSRREAARRYDNGTHGDEVPRDGVPSRILINSTDYMGPRTAANYDELKGIMFAIGDHPDGPQRFFNQNMVSLDWDGKEIPWDPDINPEPGIYRLTSLERRMYAFIITDSLDIMRAFQNDEGEDLIPYEDRVNPPSGLGSNSFQSKRESEGIEIWTEAISSGEKQELEREMLSSLAGTEIGDASWFPGGISAVSLSRFRTGTAGSLTQFGIGAGAFGGAPGGFGAGYPGAYGGGYGGYGGGYGQPFGGGGYVGQQGGAYGAGAQFGGGAFPGGIPAVPGAYNVGVPSPVTPAGGALGFAF